MKIKQCPVCESTDIKILSSSEMLPNGDLTLLRAGLKCVACKCRVEHEMEVPVGHQIQAVNASKQQELLSMVVMLWNHE